MNNKKETVDTNKVINSKNITLYNIRKNDNGLYFDIKTIGNREFLLKDLFIPSKFYQTHNINLNKSVIVINKRSILEYFLLYPAAIISLAYIIKTLASNWKYLGSLFGL